MKLDTVDIVASLLGLVLAYLMSTSRLVKQFDHELPHGRALFIVGLALILGYGISVGFAALRQ